MKISDTCEHGVSKAELCRLCAAAPASPVAPQEQSERSLKKLAARIIDAVVKSPCVVEVRFFSQPEEADKLEGQIAAMLTPFAAPASPADIRDGVCKCGLDKDDPIHSFSTEWQKMHAFTPKVTPPSTRAKAAAEEIGAWIFMLEQPLTSETDLRVATDIVQSIILKRCFAEGEDTK